MVDGVSPRILTTNSVDHEWVQLLLAMFALTGEVGHGLDLPVEQVVQQGQRHLLGRAAICADMEHIGLRHWAPHSHLWVVLISQPGSFWIILWIKKRE